MKPRTIGLLGDIHCGSHYGLWPIEDLPGGRAGNKFKNLKYLHYCFTELVNDWPELDLLVLMGDLIDGKQRKSSCTGIFTANLGEQVDAAIKVVEPLAAKAKSIIRVHGTPYHEDFDNALGKFDEHYDIILAKQVFDIDIDGQILNIAHHPSGGTTLYTGTGADRESLWSSIAGAQGSVREPRWIARAHRHEMMIQETRHKTVCLCPCFELITPFAVKVNYWKFQPTIGGVLFHPDALHESGYRFTARTFDAPMPDVTKIDSI